MSSDKPRITCMVRVEDKASFVGYREERFLAIAYTYDETSLIFSYPSGGRKIFNWQKVLWFDTAPYRADEIDE
jgi:hypothetical protein